MRDFGFTFEPEIVKAVAPEKTGEFAVWAYASTYDVDSDDCQITREALEGAKDDLLTYNTVLFNHNTDKPIGRVIETKIDNKGLLVKIVISKTESDLIEKIKDGTLSKLSIRGRAMDWTQTIADEAGKSILQITQIKLFEVSVVSVPANKEAKTMSSSIVKQLFLTKMQEVNTEKSLIADLQLLGGRLTGDDKSVIDKVLEFFKTINNNNNTMTKKITEYNFADTGNKRPVFQLNTQDISAVELAEGTTFRKQILKKGKWYHWAADNGELEITDAKIDEMIKNFKASILDSVPVPLTHTNDPSKNTGAVVDLIKTEEGLDAIIEIKDETILEKIKKGLITGISASFDPNYLVKKTKKFVGSVLLHAALVAEPYLKGMGEFVALSDEFEGREIIQLENSEFDVRASLTQVFKILADVQKHLEIKDEDLEKAAKKKGGKCKMDDGADGIYEDDGKGGYACKPMRPKKELEEITKEEKSSSEADSKETEAKADETVEIKSDEAGSKEKVVLADSVAIYGEYLKQGKVVPAQKEAFIALCDSLTTVQLSDSSIDVKKTLDSFMASQPKLVNFSEDGTVENPTEKKPIETAKTDEIPAEVKDFYMHKMNLSEEKAKEAWLHAKEIGSEKLQKSTIFS